MNMCDSYSICYPQLLCTVWQASPSAHYIPAATEGSRTDMLINLQPLIGEHSAITCGHPPGCYKITTHTFTHHVRLVGYNSVFCCLCGTHHITGLINPVWHSLLFNLTNPPQKTAVYVLFLKCIMKPTLLCHILRYDVTVCNLQWNIEELWLKKCSIDAII